MIDLITAPDEQLSQTLRLLKNQFILRGWGATIPYIGSAHCFIDRGDAGKLQIFSATPPTSSYAAAALANDKFGTYQVLSESNVPQLETQLLTNGADLSETLEFMSRASKLVVKPVDGGHGKGITVNVSTQSQLEHAIAVAQHEEKSIGGVLIQQQYLHDTILDIRVLCIDYAFSAATWRVAARVYGDGTRTIGELIVAENESEKRGRPYYAQLAVIDIEKAKEYLGARIDDVPNRGEEVAVLGVANYGAGGETIDITDALPAWLIEMAETAARASQLPVIGVDFMLAAEPTVDSTQDELDPTIIEVNKCPSLAIHENPTSGTPRRVTETYVEYLANI